MAVLILATPVGVAAQPADESVEAPEQAPSYDVIDTPPTLAPGQMPPSGVVLDRPGRVLVYGTPVRIRLQSSTEGISFHLRRGGTYSSISGVSYGWGWGGYGWGGYGWGGWGWGGWGVAPYYGEVVTKTYEPICEAPCEATLLSGRHRMALSLRGSRPVEIAEPIELSTDSVVEARYVDKRRLRKAGWAVFAAGAITGMALMFGGVNYNYDPVTSGQSIRYPGMFYTGVGLFVSSIITGSILAAQDDEAHADVYPAN